MYFCVHENIHSLQMRTQLNKDASSSSPTVGGWRTSCRAAACRLTSRSRLANAVALHCFSLGSRRPAARSHGIVRLLACRSRWSIDSLVEWRDALQFDAVRGVSGFTLTLLSMGASSTGTSTTVSFKHFSLTIWCSSERKKISGSVEIKS